MYKGLYQIQLINVFVNSKPILKIKATLHLGVDTPKTTDSGEEQAASSLLHGITPDWWLSVRKKLSQYVILHIARDMKYLPCDLVIGHKPQKCFIRYHVDGLSYIHWNERMDRACGLDVACDHHHSQYEFVRQTICHGWHWTEPGKHRRLFGKSYSCISILCRMVDQSTNSAIFFTGINRPTQFLSSLFKEKHIICSLIGLYIKPIAWPSSQDMRCPS